METGKESRQNVETDTTRDDTKVFLENWKNIAFLLPAYVGINIFAY